MSLILQIVLLLKVKLLWSILCPLLSLFELELLLLLVFGLFLLLLFVQIVLLLVRMLFAPLLLFSLFEF